MHVERFRLIATAIAGRPVEVGAAAAGEGPWTDGTTIFVDGEAPAPAQIDSVVVQASLLAAGSLDAELLRQLARRPALAGRYLAVEGRRALAANEDVLPPAVRRRLASGSVAAGSPQASLALARTREPIEAAPAAFGRIEARRVLAALDRAAVSRLGAVGQPTPGTNAPTEPDGLAELDDGDDGTDDLGHLVSSPVGGGGPIGKLLRRLLSPTRARGSGGGPPGGGDMTHRGARPGSGRRATLAGSPLGSLEGTDGAQRSGWSYPEWDVHRGRYRPAWCTVVESDPTIVDAAASAVVDDLGLHRPLARLGIGLVRCRRRRQGDDIDVDAAVEALVDTAAGAAHGQEDFYVESLRRRRDLSVLVLVDVSGSAGEPGTAGRTVHEHQRRAATSLVAALHGLGDRVAVYGFNSRGRQAVHLLRVKAFDDPLDGTAARRLASLTPGAYTRLGAAIRHGATILEERAGTPRRLLVVLSDGFAYDHGYEGRYGEADAQRALLEARRRGVGCLCLSVGTDVEPAALQRVFGTAAHAGVSRLEQLPGIVGPLFRSAMRAAEAQRRAFQRTERTKERHELERRIDGSSGTSVLRAGR